MYEYQTLATLRAGTYFMFSYGTTVLYCYHSERNLVIYKNMVTGKCRKVKGFVDLKDKIGTVRYVKILDRMFDKFYDGRAALADLPF